MENLYSPPATAFTDASKGDEPAGTPRLFSMSGRLGRLRWVLYSFTLICIGLVLTAAVSLLLQALLPYQSLAITMIRSFLPIVVMLEMVGCIACMSVRRLHDIGASGWFALLILVPVVQVFFLFAILVWPGRRGGNAYGPPTANDSIAISILACLVLLLVPVVIVASLTMSGAR